MFLQNLTACIKKKKKKKKHFFTNNKISENASLTRYWYPDSMVILNNFIGN